MHLSLGFSPCPNDTFIFDALVNNKIDTEGVQVDVHLEDVQTLNECAKQGVLDITKISYGVLPLVTENYIVLNSGGALGKGVGPLLIAKQHPAINNAFVAIPGENTTAHMLFSMAYPAVTKKRFMIFSAIEDAVLRGEVDAGVIIHENRFTYQQKGLVKLADLGENWEKETGNPIPLGGIVMKRNFDLRVHRLVDRLIRRSLEYAFEKYPHITEYVKQHSQEMSESVMRQHIDLYVNNYSLDLGEGGRAAVQKFLDIYSSLKKTNLDNNNIFLS